MSVRRKSVLRILSVLTYGTLIVLSLVYREELLDFARTFEANALGVLAFAGLDWGEVRLE